MNVRERMREFLGQHEGWEAERLAKAFVLKCQKSDLVPLLVDEFKWMVRADVRAAEVASLQTVRKRSGRVTTLADRRSKLEEFSDLLDRPYRIGDGRARRFGELTAEEHRVRVLMLRSNIDGLRRDVEVHERAIAVIENHRVSCLDDLHEAKAAA